MAGEWRWSRFSQLLAEPVRNGIYKPSEFHGRGAKIVNMGEIFACPRLRAIPMKRVELSDSESERFNVREGDLLFARRSLVAEGAGKCSIVLETDELTAFESSIIRARPDIKRTDPLFLFYFFNSPSGLHMLDTIRRQVAVAGITGSDLAELEVPAPPLSEQRAISHILGTLDDKIELNRRMYATLEAMARALFKSWFVDFDPVRAKMEGRDTGLPPEIATRFPDRLMESEVGEMPEGWEVRCLDEVGRFTNGLALQDFPPEDEDTFLPVIKIAQMRKGNTEGADRASAQLDPVYIVEDGEVLFSWSGSLEVIIWCGGRGALNQHLFKVTSEAYPKWFYYHWIRYHLSDFQEVAAGKATTMGHIQRHHLTDAKVLVPPLQTLQAMDEQITPLTDRLIAVQLESRTLAALRDALLPKLLSGQVRVPDVSGAGGVAHD
jgi:type I restriction enzyme, S subunit